MTDVIGTEVPFVVKVWTSSAQRHRLPCLHEFQDWVQAARACNFECFSILSVSRRRVKARISLQKSRFLFKGRANQRFDTAKMCKLPVEGLRVPASKPAGNGAHRVQQYDDEFLQYTYKVRCAPDVHFQDCSSCRMDCSCRTALVPRSVALLQRAPRWLRRADKFC